MTKIAKNPEAAQTAMAENLLKARLCLKIEEVAAAIGALAPDGHNSQSKYSYISSAKLMAHLRHVLPKHQLAILPELKYSQS